MAHAALRADNKKAESEHGRWALTDGHAALANERVDQVAVRVRVQQPVDAGADNSLSNWPAGVMS